MPFRFKTTRTIAHSREIAITKTTLIAYVIALYFGGEEATTKVVTCYVDWIVQALYIYVF